MLSPRSLARRVSGSRLSSFGLSSFRPSRSWLPAAWPLLAVLACAAYWLVMDAQLRHDRMLAERDAMREVRSYAEAYEQYLTRSLSQMEQVAVQLRHAWEQPGQLDLAALRRDGMFIDAAFVEVAIVDAAGRVVSSIPRRGRAVLEGDDPALRHHRQNNSSALLIGAVPGHAARVDNPGEGAQRQRQVRMTLRLESPDNEFAGMVSLVIGADYLTAFYNERVLGRHGLVALVADQGGVRLERQGGAGRGSLFSMPPPLAGGDGGALLAGAQFTDDAPRLLAWHRSAVYPVVAVAGKTTVEALASAAEGAAAVRRVWAVISAGMLFASLALAFATRRHLARRDAEEEVRLAYRTATENAKDGFYMAQAVRDTIGAVVDFVVVDCNERGASFYGVSRDDLVGRRISLIEREHGGPMLDAYHAAMHAGIHEDERQMPAGRRMQITWGRRRIVRVGNGLAITLQDISERKAYESELLYLANYDSLTGLPSRPWVSRFVPQAIGEAAQRDGTLALLLVDLDGFKHVNETHGHDAGDDLLKQAALRLGGLLRPQDIVARLGGDEFVVVISPGGADEELAAIGGRVAAALSRPYDLGTVRYAISASIGISCYPRDGEDAATLLKHGGIALAAAKREHGGRYRFFDPDLYIAATARAQLRHSLQGALAARQFELHYQPRVNLATGRLCSMEALLRWRHPELGMVPPAKFIPIAEECGLIGPIGQFVIEEACRQMALWRGAGLAVVPVSINVSAHQFGHGGVHAHLAMHLARHHLAGAMLEVEITESAMFAEGVDVQGELAALRGLGVRLHVDDFGTGYSSLAQLQRLNMDVLKIDRAFTSELTVSPEGRVLFQAIVSMAKALDMAVVAEGVETAGQLAELIALGCDEGQGYLFAAPLPARQAAGLLARPQLMSVLAGPEELAV
ncbi:EAL domain-containing protein [Pseudoduganella sp. SL102]|uniref:bifunctional diguanylate cyclase/phosphodiesterase n=1 Tax=Pseudoduganella sp. SL102 TaxID=2995154 RepID=UPI00248B802D|nr:EAL domain-containing protein [Pseudoduganella sp. SL102]WBS05614.1 EAL domain-containing protein [Pseudoduganella sp. SL102]